MNSSYNRDSKSDRTMDNTGDRIEKLYKNYEILSDAKEKIGEVGCASVIFFFTRSANGAGKRLFTLVVKSV